MRFALYGCLSVLFLFNTKMHAQDVFYVYGNSHAFSFSEVPGCVIKWTGATTMHRIGRDGLSFLDLRTAEIKEDSVVIFVYGEIDVRCHIGKQRDLFNRSQDEIIDTLARNYLLTILQNLMHKRLTCIVCSVTPPSLTADSPDFPVYGSLEDRVNISRQLNAKLADLCARTGILFLDIYKEYSNADGTLNIKLAPDKTHIHPAFNEPIKKKLEQLKSSSNRLREKFTQ